MIDTIVRLSPVIVGFLALVGVIVAAKIGADRRASTGSPKPMSHSEQFDLLDGARNDARNALALAISADNRAKAADARISVLEGLVQQLRDSRNFLRDVFLSYVERVQRGGSTELTERERESLYEHPELNAKV